MSSMKSQENRLARRHFVGGSDARVIMGGDEAALTHVIASPAGAWRSRGRPARRLLDRRVAPSGLLAMTATERLPNKTETKACQRAGPRLSYWIASGQEKGGWFSESCMYNWMVL